MDRIEIPGAAGLAVTGLTEEELAELSRKVAEANKRSRDDVLARGGGR